METNNEAEINKLDYAGAIMVVFVTKKNVEGQRLTVRNPL